jgi:hypothetical protein
MCARFVILDFVLDCHIGFRCFRLPGLSVTKWWAALSLARKRPFRLPKLAVGVIVAFYVARTIEAYAENRTRTRGGGAPRAAHNLGGFMAGGGDRARRKVLAGVDHKGASRHGSSVIAFAHRPQSPFRRALTLCAGAQGV